MTRSGARALAPQTSALLLSALASLIIAACADDPQPSGSVDATPTIELELLSVRSAAPLLAGTRLVAEVRGVVEGAGEVALAFGEVPQARLPASALEAGRAEFSMTARALATLAPGSNDVAVALVQGERRSEPLDLVWSAGGELPLRLDPLPGGRLYRDSEFLVTGAGFIDGAEGELVAHVIGTLDAGADPVDVDARVPLALVDFAERDRAAFSVTSALGGIGPGELRGTLRVERRIGDDEARSEARELAVELLPPALFGPERVELALGEYLELTGGGLLGTASSSESTLVRLEGSFRSAHAEADEPARDIDAVELVAIVEGHDAARLELPFEEREGRLVSAVFGDDAGVFAGTVTPLVIDATEQVEGDPLAVELELLGVHQHVEVVFLPGFFESLREFGLSAAADEVVARALRRMNDIYAEHPVFFELEANLAFVPRARARLEIGGPDPNGRGLLGYDNTPGKDIGNLRLHDVIGGANAETQADDYPGYGGVFIESFLYWSANPGLPGERPAGAPVVDPLFDILFSEVRATPATLAEVRGEGERARVVDAAVDALAAMIGETAAHEVGHSLGLAQPYGGREAFHSALPGPGCLMDSGRDRPLGERAAQPGFEESRFCFDEPDYLDEILGTIGSGAD